MRNDLFRERYGFDNLSLSLILVSLLFYQTKYLWIIGMSLLGIAVYRTFSKNLIKRSEELEKYQAYMLKYRLLMRKTILLLMQSVHSWTHRIRQKKQFKVFRCPKCAKKLRVPRGKGTIRITCTQCGHVFVSRS